MRYYFIYVFMILGLRSEPNRQCIVKFSCKISFYAVYLCKYAKENFTVYSNIFSIRPNSSHENEGKKLQ